MRKCVDRMSVQVNGMIELKGVSRTFKGGDRAVAVLKDVDLVVPRGELSALTGASGSGKTTLMNIIGLIDRPDRGAVELDGIDVTSLGSDDIARIRNHRIGFVFQSFHLLSRLTALDNVALPLLYRGWSRSTRRDRAARELDRVGLADRSQHRPNELSGGQCQRVAIARALVVGPGLILADEPTGALDSATATDIMNLFIALNRDLGMTVVIVTHDPTIAARCPRRIVMRDGMIVDDNRSALHAVEMGG